MQKIKWALFISGQGSNMSALLDLREEYPIGLVVSSKPSAYGLVRARRLGVETLVLTPEIDWVQLIDFLHERQITHIFLTGFMRVVSSEFLKGWHKPILNVHPSLLPSYPGLKSLARASADDAPIGVTVHKVTADVDAGETVLQQTVFATGTKALTQETVEYYTHLAEYALVRKSMGMASCWT